MLWSVLIYCVDLSLTLFKEIMCLKLMEQSAAKLVRIPVVLMFVAALASLTCTKPVCSRGSFYDEEADVCTDCHLICDERRNTPHLCEKHSTACQGMTKYHHCESKYVIV